MDRKPNENDAFAYLTTWNPPFPSGFALRSGISLIPSPLAECTAEPLALRTVSARPLSATSQATLMLATLSLVLGGARKVRFAGRGKGKSGGYRVITFYTGPAFPVFLLNIFAKGEKINLTMAECNALRVILAEIAATYRKGVRRHDQGR